MKKSNNDELYSELDELRLYKSEHERLKKELNEILHPNGDGPAKPSFYDLVSYVRGDLRNKDRIIAELRDDVSWLKAELKAEGKNNIKPLSHIVCAAIKKGDRIICGVRHFDAIMRDQIEASERIPYWKRGVCQGFVNQRGEFLNREEAWIAAQQSNQIKRECYDGQNSTLYSENLY